MSVRRIGPPPGAVPTLEASNQAQIEDLVQRNRTLEHKNTKLAEQLAAEAARGRDAVATIQRQWEANQREWRDGCADVLSAYRIVQRQVELERERAYLGVVREMAVTRDEKLQRLQRDFKLKLFQMKEEELEMRVDEVETLRRSEVEEMEEALGREERRAASITTKLKETKEALARSVKERDDKEARYNKLVAEHSNMEAASGTLDTKVQRTQLKLEGALNKIADLERANDELKRSNTDLSNQLERWENLETKGGEAKEKEHKKRIALELELKELKEQFEQQEEELAKAKRKVEKMRDVAANYESEAKEQATLAADTSRQLAKIQKQVDRLKSDLEVERARVRPPSPHIRRESSAHVQEQVDAEVISDGSPPPAPKPRARAGARNANKAGPSRSAQAVPYQIARKTPGGPKPSKLQAAIASDDEGLSVTEDPAPAPRSKGKSKAAPIEVDGEEQEENAVPRKRGRRKAVEVEDEPASGEDDVRIVEPPPKTRKPSSKARAGSRAPSKAPAIEVVEAPDVEEEPKKKKRKIIFPSATGNASGPFAFPSLNQFDDGGLGIPSILSPVKAGEPVPQRSGPSSFMKALGRK